MADGTITGTVTDPYGDPVEDVYVQANLSSDGSYAAYDITAEDGSYSMSVAPDDYDVFYEKGGFEKETRQNVTVTSGDKTTVDVQFSHAYRKVIADRGSTYGTGLYARNTASSGWNSAIRAVNGTDDTNSTSVLAKSKGQGYGLYAKTDDNAAINAEANGTVIEAESTSVSGVGASIRGISQSPNVTPVEADSEAGSGPATAINATILSNSGTVINAYAQAGSGTTTGVDATVNSPGGTGVYAAADADSGSSYGVDARMDSPDGTAVYATANANTGTPEAVYGDAVSPDGYGVFSDGQLAVERDVTAADQPSLRDHAATVTNTSADPQGDVLALKSEVDNPGTDVNYVSFLEANDGLLGAIEGDGGGSVVYTGKTADFAEYFPKADPGAAFEPGEVVGLRDGAVVPAGEATDATLVVTTDPLLAGNDPMEAAAREDAVALSLVGQVPVRVSGSVESGDVLVASPDGDGTAVSREGEGSPALGMALEGADPDDEDVLALVGGQGVDPASGDRAADVDRDLRAEVAALEAENEDLRAALDRKDQRIETLEDRLAAVESHLGLGDGTAGPSPADD